MEDIDVYLWKGEDESMLLSVKLSFKRPYIKFQQQWAMKDFLFPGAQLMSLEDSCFKSHDKYIFRSRENNWTRREFSKCLSYRRVARIPVVATKFWQLSFPLPPVFHATVIHTRLWGFFLFILFLFLSGQLSTYYRKPLIFITHVTALALIQVCNPLIFLMWKLCLLTSAKSSSGMPSSGFT